MAWLLAKAAPTERDSTDLLLAQMRAADLVSRVCDISQHYVSAALEVVAFAGGVLALISSYQQSLRWPVCGPLQAGILGGLLNLYRSGNPMVRPAAFNALFVCIDMLEVSPAEPLWMEFSTNACHGYIRIFVACAGNRSGPCADTCVRALVDHLIVLAEYN